MFYLRLNDASPDNFYWSQPAQNWTIKPGDATMFQSFDDADTEARYAEFSGVKGEIVVCERRQ